MNWLTFPISFFLGFVTGYLIATYLVGNMFKFVFDQDEAYIPLGNVKFFTFGIEWGDFYCFYWWNWLDKGTRYLGPPAISFPSDTVANAFKKEWHDKARKRYPYEETKAFNERSEWIKERGRELKASGVDYKERERIILSELKNKTWS